MNILSKTIEIGETQSAAISLNEQVLVGLIAGSGITSDEITFLVSNDGSNYYSLYDETSEVSITTGSIVSAYALESKWFIPWSFVKVREGNSGSAVAQADWNASLEFTLRDYMI